MIRISVLSENTVDRDELTPEDGLSLFIETSDHKIMMDAGGSDTAINNAGIMEVPIYEADMAVLSHDHFDHGLGFISYYEMVKDLREKLSKLLVNLQNTNLGNGLIQELSFSDPTFRDAVNVIIGKAKRPGAILQMLKMEKERRFCL